MEIMARNRIKVHPFGYVKFKKSVLGKNYTKDSKHPVQTVIERLSYIIHKRDKRGRIVQTDTCYNTFVKNIKHSSANRPSKGRTLAEMVYNSHDDNI